LSARIQLAADLHALPRAFWSSKIIFGTLFTGLHSEKGKSAASFPENFEIQVLRFHLLCTNNTIISSASLLLN
jgi:hypothetical protein